jgi:hypothetical protein
VETLLRRYLLPLAVSLMILVMSGCVSVRLVADYDEQVDAAVTQFQRKMEHFLVSLERNIGKDEASYAHNTRFYDDLRVDLSSMRVRAAAIPDNDITTQQLALLSNSVTTLEKLHRLGISANDIPPIRTALNTSCTAILKLELAKKRGKP